jgi:pimeloyl-ACP methyl ester carboxylesterase
MTFALALALACTAFFGLGLIAFWSLRKYARFELVPAHERPPESGPRGTFRTVFFPACDGARIEGWLFGPPSSPTDPRAGFEHGRAPLVIMAPGLTGTKEGFYERYAWQFAERGLATLIIDFRCFGGSEGMPRHWVDPQRHAEDYRSAIAFARRGGLPGVDPERIALWGSSFSGGVSLVAAAADSNICAVVAQCPFVATSKAQEPAWWAMAIYVVAATLDLAGLLPIYVPAFGRPGEWAFAQSLENPSARDFDGTLGSPFWRALPKPLRGGWENKFLARMLARFDEFQPLRAVAELRCPILFVAAERDDMVLLEQVRKAHALVPARDKHLLELPCGHFDLYCGELAEPNARQQAAFLERVMFRHASPSMQPVSQAPMH